MTRPNQGVSSLPLGEGKRRSPGNEVDPRRLQVEHNQLTQMWHRILSVFLTVFAIFSSESFADTLVFVSFVNWQTHAVVLTGPASAGCLQKNMYYDGRF